MSRLTGRSSPPNPLAGPLLFDNWSEETIDTTTIKLYTPTFVEYVLGNFVIGGPAILTADNSTGQFGFKKSSDGEAWSHGASNSSNTLVGVASDGTYAVFLLSSSSQIRYSSDLATWNTGGHNIDTTYSLNGIAFGAGVFVVVGQKAATGIGLYSSATGLTTGSWTKRTNPGGLGVNAFAFSPKYNAVQGFLALCLDGASMYALCSADGITWTKNATNNVSTSTSRLAVNDNAAVIAHSTKKMEVSTNSGVTWTNTTFFEDLFTATGRTLVPGSLSAVGDGFVISTISGTGSNPNWYEEQIYFSEDGLLWEEAAALPEVLGASQNENPGGFAYASGKLVHAVGNSLANSNAAIVPILATGS